MDPKQLENAIKHLGVKRLIEFNGERIKLACLLRSEDRRPFRAEWWKGKESYLIAVDDNANFYLRHCGGYVFRTNPTGAIEETLAKSETEFLSMIDWEDQ
ncbi:MAG: hypothetical protein AAF431_07520 [Pseudomonadota bacterium]